MYKSDDIIQILLINRVSGKIIFYCKLQCLLHGLGVLHSNNLLPWCHDILRFFVSELKDVVDKLHLAFFDQALFMPFLNHGKNLFFYFVFVHLLRKKLSKTTGSAL